MKMLDTTPRVFTHAEAAEVVAAYGAGDAEWTYAAEPALGHGAGVSFVSVIDEGGEFVAYVT